MRDRTRSVARASPAAWASVFLLAACSTSLAGCDDSFDPPGSSDGGGALADAGDAEVPPPDALPAAALKVVSFNIRFDNPNDGVNAWPVRREMVYRLFREMDADVAGLQEVLVWQLDELVAALPEYQRVGVGRGDGANSDEFSPILYRASRFEVDASGTFWFSDTPEVPGSRNWGNGAPRICTWARLVEKSSGRALHVFNVHLDNISQVSREKSVTLLMKRISERPGPGDPFLVTGDFNVAESDVVISFMKGAAPLEGAANPLPMVDSFRVLHPDATGVGTFHNFRGGTDSPKIDFIFTRPVDRTTAAEIILKQENGLYPSDHYPVTATVEIAGW